MRLPEGIPNFLAFIMHHSKLVRQLRILTAPELKRLLQFLKSPFYNANPAIVKLYLLLREHYPEFESLALAKEKVFRKLFAGRAYEHQKMLNLMSDFTALLEQYMIVLQLEKEDLEQKKLLIQAYSERPDCYEVFEKKLWELDKYLDALPYRDELYFREKKDLNLLYFGHPGTDMVAEGQDALKNALRYFETFKELSATKLQCSWNAWENAVGARKTIQPESLDFDTDTPPLLLYKKLATLQRTPETEADLQALVSLFTTHIQAFRPGDQSNILKILLNYCSRQFNKGHTRLIDASFELYKTGLEHGSLLINGKMKESTFQNIIAVGIYCKAFDWTKAFMDRFQEYLDLNVRADAVALGMGQWHFEQKDYWRTIEVLERTFREPQEIIKSKTLLSRAWFELSLKDESYHEVLLAQLDSFEKFTRRNSAIPPRLSEGVLNFIEITRKLASNMGDKKKLAQLKIRIEAEPNLTLKNWLLEKTT